VRACAHAHFENDACVGKVVVDDFGHLWEVPAVPFLGAHSIGVELFVKVVEQTDGVDDHCVDFIRGEFYLVAG